MAESFTERFLGYNEFVLDSPYFRRSIPSAEFELEDALFNFSNVVGGWITYILIQSMNPANKLTDHIKDVTENNALIQSWIGDAISLIQPYLLFNLNYCINMRLETLSKRASGFKDEKSRDKIFVLDDEIASELNDAFSNLYPNLSRELEKLRAELPMLVRREIDEMNSYAEKIRRQKLCKPHEYIVENDYDEFRILKCKRCEKRKREEK